MHNGIRIAIGSCNPVKHAAAQEVLAELFPAASFTAVDVPSGVSVQPWGEEETRAGALHRARAALEQTGADLAIGFEGGLIETELGLMTCAWCAVIGRDGRLGVGGGSHMLLPPAAGELLATGMELGSVMDALTGRRNTKHDLGAIGILTAGLESRQSAYAHILRLALAPFLSPAYYSREQP